MPGDELKKLLEALFEDLDELSFEDITVLKGYCWPLRTNHACCTYSYGAYNG